MQLLLLLPTFFLLKDEEIGLERERELSEIPQLAGGRARIVLRSDSKTCVLYAVMCCLGTYFQPISAGSCNFSDKNLNEAGYRWILGFRELPGLERRKNS